MKKALIRNRSAVKERVKFSSRFSRPVISNTARLKAVNVAGYDAFTIGLSRLSSSPLDIMLAPLGQLDAD